MTNFEKYSKNVESTNFAVVNGKPVSCYETPCNTCDLSEEKTDIACAIGKIKWLKAEYEEPKITIPEGTPIDAKVLVSDTGEDWFKRHYAGCVDGFHYAWNEGRTSWSSNPSNKIAWEYMKLHE